MSKKIDRSRVHARAALDAYVAAHEPGAAADAEPAVISDLIADLLHLADRTFKPSVQRHKRGARVEQLAITAIEHFNYERDPHVANEEV